MKIYKRNTNRLNSKERLIQLHSSLLQTQLYFEECSSDKLFDVDALINIKPA